MRLTLAAGRERRAADPSRSLLSLSLEVVEMRRFFNRMRPSHRNVEPVPAVAAPRIPAPTVGDRIAFIPAQRDRRAHTAF